MTTYTTTRAERETIIRYDEADRIVTRYTASPTEIRRMDKLVHEHPDIFKCIWVDDFYGAKKYQYPLAYERGPKQPVSEARRKASRANAAKMRTALEKRTESERKSDLSISPEEKVD